jgi:flagellar biosynthesis/type III secretory pathway protein FliH
LWKLLQWERGARVAATRAIRADLRDTDASGSQVLERLQYRTAQSGISQAGSSQRNSHHGTASASDWVALFPNHAEDFAGMESSQSADPRPATEIHDRRRLAELEKRLEEGRLASEQAVAMAHEQGRREGRQAVEQQIIAEQQRMQAQIVQSLEQFRLERQSYFHNVEGEVVRLALAIAARVLHREAHLDPLLLSGAVRVALEKLGDSSNVVMRVPPREVGHWKEFYRAAGNLRGCWKILLFLLGSVCWRRSWAPFNWVCERSWKKLKKAFSTCWIASPWKPSQILRPAAGMRCSDVTRV